MTKRSARRGSPKGITKRDVVASRSRFIRSIQSAYADAGKPLAEDLAARANVSPATLRGVLLHGVCPATIVWMERLMDAIGVQMVVMPKRQHPETDAGGADASPDSG